MRRDVAVKAGVLVGPDDDLATVAALRGVGCYPRGGVEGGALGVGHVSVSALVVAPDQHLATGQLAAGVDAGTVQVYRVAGQQHAAAVLAGGVDLARAEQVAAGTRAKRADVDAATVAQGAAGAQLCAHTLHDLLARQCDAATRSAAALGRDGGALPDMRGSHADLAALHAVGMQRAVQQGHTVGADGDVAAAPAGAGGINSARVEHGVGLQRNVAAEQGDVAVTVLHRTGFDLAGVVDYAGQQRLFGPRRHDDPAAVGPDQPAVVGQAVEHALVDLHLDQTVAVEVERGGAARAQYHGAQRGRDRALVANGVAQQGHKATVGGSDAALVDDAARGTGAIAAERSCIATQAGVMQVECGGHQAADIDLGTGPEQDAVGVDQIDLAVGAQVAQDLAAVGIKNAVDGNGRGRGLHEVDRLLHGDVEAFPGQREVLAGLGDGGVGPGLRNGARACADLSARRPGLRKGCQVQAPRERYGPCDQTATGAGLATPFGVFGHRDHDTQSGVPDETVDAVHGGVAFHLGRSFLDQT